MKLGVGGTLPSAAYDIKARFIITIVSDQMKQGIPMFASESNLL